MITALFAVVAGLMFCATIWRMGWLTAGGSVLAGLYGVSLIVLGGWEWLVPALVFLVTSSLLSKLPGRTTTGEADHPVRNGLQVLANGGVAWLMLIGYAVFPHTVWYWGFLGATAAATSDTWATEIGVMSRRPPRSILTWRAARPGTSGAVSILGLAASAAGAVLIGLSALAVLPGSGEGLLAAVALAGFAGSLADSLVGATLQARYRTKAGDLTEDPARGDVLVKGRRHVTNDAVNALCTATGACLAAIPVMWL